MKVGVFGLGSMGYGMAVSLVKDGHDVWGFDVNDTQVEKFVAEGGARGDIAQVVPVLDVVLIVVLNADQTESVLFGEKNVGVAEYMNSSASVVACATVSPEFAREMSRRCNEREISYLDAPISGGAIKAAQGKLSIMASGNNATFENVRPVLNSIAETVFELGEDAGTGSAMKAVNQLLAGVHIASMAEAVTFGISQGISAEQTVDVITKCAGSSWMFENRAPHIVKGDYSPKSAIDIWLKDLGIVLEIAQSSDFSAPLTQTALQQFKTASDSGLGKEDDAAVAKVYARNAKIKLPTSSS